MDISELNDLGINKKNILAIIKTVACKMNIVKRLLMDQYSISFSNKNLSEIIGKILEKETADYLSNHTEYNVLNANRDRRPDLTFKKNDIVKFVEIKVTSTDSAWTGGEFSKRPFDYLLVSWGGVQYDEFFVAYTHLEKQDWESRIQNNYYGPSFRVTNLNEKTDKIIFLGRINERGTRLEREKIDLSDC